jgi:hypothetical protein
MLENSLALETDENMAAIGKSGVYCTVVHLATRRRKISCGAQKQLFHLDSGPFGHPTKEN